MNLEDLLLRPLERLELDQAIEWAAEEGWNPGLHDADIFWETDPAGFVGAEYEGNLVATGSIVSYDDNFGFMGFFIVRPDLRGKGIGTKLWFFRRDQLRSRLNPGAAIGMDGVFDMQDWYARGGFQFTHRNLRMHGTGQAASRHPLVVPLRSVPLDQVYSFDQSHFGCARDSFIKSWITMPDSTALGFVDDNRLCGFGTIRQCREGHKIGPLFAETPEAAEQLFTSLSSQADGKPIWMDIPENNSDAVALATRHGMTEVFGCARMYHGEIPDLPWNQIYGITTFELG